jgi:hypothetical protein
MKERNMFSVKKSPIALVGILVLTGSISALMPLVGRGQGGNPLNRDPRRLVYVTKTLHDGSQALSACADGYHMASFWEIFDPSNLKYNTELGNTSADSGSGPPIGIAGQGWVRTGAQASTGLTLPPGFTNCNAWTSANEADAGTSANLFLGEGSGSLIIVRPWIVASNNCTFAQRVWCIQD